MRTGIGRFCVGNRGRDRRAGRGDHAGHRDTEAYLLDRLNRHHETISILGLREWQDVLLRS